MTDIESPSTIFAPLVAQAIFALTPTTARQDVLADVKATLRQAQFPAAEVEQIGEATGKAWEALQQKNIAMFCHELGGLHYDDHVKPLLSDSWKGWLLDDNGIPEHCPFCGAESDYRVAVDGTIYLDATGYKRSFEANEEPFSDRGEPDAQPVRMWCDSCGEYLALTTDQANHYWGFVRQVGLGH